MHSAASGAVGAEQPDPRSVGKLEHHLIDDSRFGKVPEARKGGAIIVYDFEGTAIKRYNLINAWPKKLEIGSLKAGDTVVVAEKLTLTYGPVAPAGA
jgi:phage tail-like protein